VSLSGQLAFSCLSLAVFRRRMLLMPVGATCRASSTMPHRQSSSLVASLQVLAAAAGHKHMWGRSCGARQRLMPPQTRPQTLAWLRCRQCSMVQKERQAAAAMMRQMWQMRQTTCTPSAPLLR